MLTERKILQQWFPILAVWFLMALDLAVASSIVARGVDSEINLAAFNISFALSVLVESPIIMMLVVSIKLVEGKHSFLLLRKFCYSLNLLLTLIMIFLLTPWVFNLWIFYLLGLEKEVSDLVYSCLSFFVLWPAMIGYRRFYQGLIIKTGQNKKLIYGTLVRLVTLASFSFYLLNYTMWQSAEIASFSINLALVFEACAVRFFARKSILIIRDWGDNESLTYKNIYTFYSPLVLTAVISLSTQPIANLSAAYGVNPLKSLAVLPVINTFVFIFKAIAISYQEVIISLIGKKEENLQKLFSFAFKIFIILIFFYFLIIFTPLNFFWFKKIAGLPSDLIVFALPALKVMIAMPVLSLVSCWQKSLLLSRGKTKKIGYSSILEISTIALLLFFLVNQMRYNSVLCIMFSLIIGRLIAIFYLTNFRKEEIKIPLDERI